MIQQDPFRTIQIQRNQINQLKVRLEQTLVLQNKYKKALKEISQIIKANRQLKEELKRLSNLKFTESDSQSKIKQQELGKAYEKLLKEKNQMLGQKEAVELENEKLKYSMAALQEAISKLKNQKISLAQEKQGLKLNSGTNEKLRQKDSTGLKQRENDLKKVVQNYEERINSLTRNNRKLEDQVAELENKLYRSEIEYKQKINQKDYEIKVGKISSREQFQGQINSLKKQIAQLKNLNNELTNRVSSYSNVEMKSNQENQYDGQLIETLRDLKMQMGPMSAQIAELQQKNDSQNEQNQREKASLQIKVVEYEAQIERVKQSYKLLEQRFIKQTQKSRKWDDCQRTIRKLEEENRMLGGRVIVLEAKEVALRNRSGDQLQERVLEFQSRVQMLLNDKETIGSLKNIGIHQLIALKAYIMELDGKLKQVVNQNEYAVKKYKSYKQKCTQLIRELKQHDIAINALKGKLQGYDRLVVKLQGELQRAITINDNEMKAINVKISQSTINSIQVYKKRYQSLLQKLNLQEKYAEQEIQTLKLNYDTKLLDLNLKLEQLNSIKQTIGLYKNKNEQLSNRLTQKQNELLESKMTKVIITDTIPQQKNPHKDTINKLHETINTKETTIINLENQMKRAEIEWKGKYNQLEQIMNNSTTKKTRDDEEKKRQIEQLQNQIRTYRIKINELESKSPGRVEQDHDFRRPHLITGQISDLQVELQQMRNRYEIENTKVGKLTKTNAELKQANNDLEVELSKIRFQLKRVSKQMEIELEDKNSEIKRVQSLAQENLETSRSKKPESQNNNFKLATIKMQYQMLQSQTEQLERDKTKYYNRALDLERHASQLNMKIQELSYSLERAKSTLNNEVLARQTQKQQEIEKLQFALKNFQNKNADLQDRINEYESQVQKIRGELSRQRQRLQSQIDFKDDEIEKISRQLNKIRHDIGNKEDMKLSIEKEYEYKINRFNNELLSLREQLNHAQQSIQRYEAEIRFSKNKQLEFNSKATEQENYLYKLNNELKNIQNREVDMQSQMMQKQTLISKLTSELNYIRAQISNIQVTIQNKDNQIAKLTSELTSIKNSQFQWQMQVSSRASDFNKLQSEITFARNKIQSLEQELSSAKSQLTRQKSQYLLNEQSYSSQIESLQQKQNVILRLQSENKSKNEHINELNYELQSKNSKITELQNQSLRYRSISSDIQSELMQKNNQINRLNYDINNWKIRYQNLENQHQSADSNWANLNRELNNVRSQINTYEDDLAMKDMTIERYKSDIKDLTQQMEHLNQQIFQKTNTINNLNQQLFRLKLEGQQKSSEQIYRLQNQIYQLKSKLSNLQGQLQYKQEELNRAKLQISTVRSNISVNKYTDQEYEYLQVQFYQVQKSLTETKSIVSEKDLEVTQLQGKIQHLKRLQAEAKRRFAEQRNDLQSQLQNVLNRERQLRNEITNLENQALLSQNRHSDQKEWGMHLYQQQCDRLTKIVSQLQEEVNSLKLKLTYMTNQQDRIMQNLTLMTLTFAEVEALRQRMKIKEVEINEVRKSLINFAASSEQITSMGSRMLIKQRISMSHEKENRSQQKFSLQNIGEGNNFYNSNYKRQNNLFAEPSSNYGYQQRQKNLYQNIEGYNFKKEYDKNIGALGAENKYQIGYTYKNQSEGAYHEQTYPQERKLLPNASAGNNQQSNREVKRLSENADQKKEFLSLDPKYKQFYQQRGSSKAEDQIKFNVGNYKEVSQSNVQSNKQQNRVQLFNEDLKISKQQIELNSIKKSELSNQSIQPTNTQSVSQYQPLGQQSANIFIPAPSTQLQQSLSSQQLFGAQQPSWRYGSQTTAINQTAQLTNQINIGKIGHTQEMQGQALQTTQPSSQFNNPQPVRVNYGPNGPSGSIKMLSPPPNTISGQYTNIMIGQSQSQVQPQAQVSFQNRQFSMLQSQPLQYPGFAR